MKLPTIDYYEWVQELKRVAIVEGFTQKGVANTDWEAFKDYYIDGYTPAEAILEDLSNA